MATADERDALRGGIERTHSTSRDGIEQQYIQDKRALEDQYHADLQQNAEDRRAALVAAGLNSDGTDPQGRPTG